MSQRFVVLVAVTVAIAVLCAWWLRSAGSSPLANSRRAEPATATSTPASSVAPMSRDDDALSQQRVATAESSSAPAAVEQTATAERLRGRVVDSRGAPLGGASVTASFAIDDGFDVLDLDPPAPAVVARGLTDERGEFALDVDAKRSFHLIAEASSFIAAGKLRCQVGDFVELVLRRPAAVYGRVTRRDGGTPVAEARVECRPAGRDGWTPRTVRSFVPTDADGRYRLDGMASGDVVLSVQPAREARPEPMMFQLAEGESREQDVELDPGATIRGRVTDAATGLPIEGARVGESWTASREVVTDADGAYTFNGFAPRSAILTARARGYGQLERGVCDLRTQVVDEVADFALTPQLVARGRVVDAHGTPLGGVYVAAVASEVGEGMFNQRTDWRAGLTDARGAFELRELRRDVPHALFARRVGFGVLVLDFPDITAETALVELGDVVLPSGSVISGVVVDGGQQPLPAMVVTLRGTNSERWRLRDRPRTETWALDMYVASRDAVCDTRGRFAFADVAPGRYKLCAQLDDNHGQEAERAIVVEAGAQPDDVVLVVDVGLAIEGRVVARDGGALPTVYVSVDPEGEGGNADCEVQRDGRFSARGLSAGTYTLSAYPYASDAQRAAGRAFLPTMLHGVASGSRDVVIELRAAQRVRGRVVDSAGSPVANVSIRAFDAHGEQVDNAVSGPDGAFEIDVAVDEACELRAFAHDDDENPLARAPASGAIELRLPPG